MERLIFSYFSTRSQTIFLMCTSYMLYNWIVQCVIQDKIYTCMSIRYQMFKPIILTGVICYHYQTLKEHNEVCILKIYQNIEGWVQQQQKQVLTTQILTFLCYFTLFCRNFEMKILLQNPLFFGTNWTCFDTKRPNKYLLKYQCQTTLL